MLLSEFSFMPRKARGATRDPGEALGLKIAGTLTKLDSELKKNAGKPFAGAREIGR